MYQLLFFLNTPIASAPSDLPEIPQAWCGTTLDVSIKSSRSLTSKRTDRPNLMNGISRRQTLVYKVAGVVPRYSAACLIVIKRISFFGVGGFSCIGAPCPKQSPRMAATGRLVSPFRPQPSRVYTFWYRYTIRYIT